MTNKKKLLRTLDGSLDGRSLRRTGRTAQLGVRVAEEFPRYVKQLAAKEGCTIGALIENAVYQVHPRRRKKSSNDPSLG